MKCGVILILTFATAVFAQAGKDSEDYKEFDRPKALPNIEDVMSVIETTLTDEQIAKAIRHNPDGMIKVINKKINKNAYPQACPNVKDKLDCPKDAKSNCWTPGQIDVDCPKPNIDRKNPQADELFNLCCFNGCVNSCLVEKTCKVIMEEYTEMKTYDQCTDSTREECSDVPKTECKEVCKQIKTFVDEKVPYEVCEDKQVEKCKMVTEEHEQCRTWKEELTSFKNPIVPDTCPMPEENPQDCDSNCWSPGSPDVDCPLPSGPNMKNQEFGLCCFNGCANKCLQTVEPEIPPNCELSAAEQCTVSDDLVCELNAVSIIRISRNFYFF